MIKQEEVYKIGKIGKPHGVKGELTLFFDDDVFDRVDAQYLVLCIDGIMVPFFMDEYRFKTDETALVKFCDIDTKERASQLTGCEVFFPRSLSDSSDDQLSWSEIVGFSIMDTGGGKIGTVAAVDDTTENVLFEVETEGGGMTLIPASDDFITGVDTARRTITMTLPDGLLALE